MHIIFTVKLRNKQNGNYLFRIHDKNPGSSFDCYTSNLSQAACYSATNCHRRFISIGEEDVM